VETAERDHEDLLHEVLEIGAIAEHAIEVAGDLAAEPVIELVVRAAIVGAAALDQLRLVDRAEHGDGAGVSLHAIQHTCVATGLVTAFEVSVHARSAEKM